MAEKRDILENIKRHIDVRYDMPDLDIKGIEYPDKEAQFIEMNKFVGGSAVLLDEDENINDVIRSLYPDAVTITSNLSEIKIATASPDNVSDPRELNGTDLAIISADIGVAENGCVWIPQNVKEKVIYFIAENLVIILEKRNLVNNMHEAYEKLSFHGKGFGVFISGPSKTADIEQALVVGAHGARAVTVILV